MYRLIDTSAGGALSVLGLLSTQVPKELFEGRAAWVGVLLFGVFIAFWFMDKIGKLPGANGGSAELRAALELRASVDSLSDRLGAHTSIIGAMTDELGRTTEAVRDVKTWMEVEDRVRKAERDAS